MKTTLIILLIGAIVAVACAAPVSTQDDDGDKIAKAAFWNIAKRVIGGINHAVNGEKLALNQDDDDDDDDLLSQALATTEEDDDGDDAEAQFHLHFHFG